MLVSSWPVETVSSRLLSTDIFDRMTRDDRLSRARALQQAASKMINTAYSLNILAEWRNGLRSSKCS